jgi:hypothetical protein
LSDGNGNQNQNGKQVGRAMSHARHFTPVVVVTSRFHSLTQGQSVRLD